jgi:entericidin B
MTLVSKRNLPANKPFRIFSGRNRHRRLNKMETMMHKLSIVLTLLALIGATPLLAACQTTAGAGRDLSNGGNALTNSAEKNAPPGDRR